MDSWYLSYERFEKRIVKKWDKEKFNYNSGNINILKYAYSTLMFWAVAKEDKKVSNKNQNFGHPRLF